MDRNTAVTTWRDVCGNDTVMASGIVTGRMLEDFARRIEAAERARWAVPVAAHEADLRACVPVLVEAGMAETAAEFLKAADELAALALGPNVEAQAGQPACRLTSPAATS